MTLLTSVPIPLLLTLGYSAFMAVLVPVYLRNYGPTNFVYFCDTALLLTLAGVWLQSPLLISTAAVGILLPQGFWLLDYLLGLSGQRGTGITAYMFDRRRSLLLRGLSLFHGWLPIFLLLLLHYTGYDRRALWLWTAIASVLVLVSYFWLPPPTPQHGIKPVNLNYVYGFSDELPQAWMPARAWLALVLIGSPLALYLPTHYLLAWLYRG